MNKNEDQIPGHTERSRIHFFTIGHPQQRRQKGKTYPTGSLQKRIAALKGPIRLTTYVSLTCTNCPDVVQALNLMAILNDNIEHEMVDGR